MVFSPYSHISPEINREFGQFFGKFGKFQFHHCILLKKLYGRHCDQNEHICTTEKVTSPYVLFFPLMPSAARLASYKSVQVYNKNEKSICIEEESISAKTLVGLGGPTPKATSVKVWGS